MVLCLMRRLTGLHLRQVERAVLGRPWNAADSLALDRDRALKEAASHGR